MNPFFRIEMLPAQQGDCLWIEYGDPQHPSRVLVDGGTPETFAAFRQRLSQVPENDRRFELLIVTHIDNDHIGGALELLGERPPGLSFDDIWFNGWRHLPGSGFEEFGPVQGEKLTILLDQPGCPWNEHFNRHTVVVPDAGPLPAKALAGGMQLTLLSPGTQELSDLRPVWETECRKAGLDPAKPPPPPELVPQGVEVMGTLDINALAATPFKADTSEANGSSIAVLAEFGGHRALLGGDAHAGVLLRNVKRLAANAGQERLKLDAFKLPHHGSKANVSQALLAEIECPRYLFSTNGAQFKHPDKEAVARTIRFGGPGVELIFNYHSEFSALWESSSWMSQYGYRVDYPAMDNVGKVVEL